MVSDLDRTWNGLNSPEADQTKAKDSKKEGQDESDLAKQQSQAPNDALLNFEKASSNDLAEIYKQRFLMWMPKRRYELTWHKQITADTYSRILRRAYRSKPSGWNRIRQKIYRLIKAKDKSNIFKELDMNFYQNDFNYAYMAGFNTSSCSILRSAISAATIVDVGFLNIDRIRFTSFENTNLHNCRFRGGVAELDTKFTSCKFFRGSFENIYLKGVDFYGTVHDGVIFDGENPRSTFLLKMDQCSFNYSTFTKCTFKNCYINYSAFADCYFEDVSFENVIFTESYFCNSSIKRVSFANCSGLQARHFYKYYQLDPETKLPSPISRDDIDQLEKSATEQFILNCPLSASDRTYLQSLFANLKK
jgi:uncharacterized protein YjbI with pentapeptide repeats